MDKRIENIIYYSVALKGYDELDFKYDALAGVRSCYFKENCRTQQGDTIRQFEEAKLNYCYCLEENKPMLWKVFKNRVLVQASKYLPDNVYCICFYNSDELVTKKIYFNQKHYWTKTEYFIPEKGSDCVCSIAPKIINGYFALIKTDYSEGGCEASPLYMVTAMPNCELCKAVAYSNIGMVYFTSQTPSNIEKVSEERQGFTFTPNDFNLARNLNSTFDISFAPYLTEENGNPVDKRNAVDKNKEKTTESVDENSEAYEEIMSAEIQSTDSTDDSDACVVKADDDIEPDYDFSEDEDINIYHVQDFSVKKSDYKTAEKPNSDKIINDGQSKFTYYGSLDENGNRSGYGRTETSRGKTAYEGEYKNDMRNGFGSFYYKDGSINYIGNWTDNKRNGRGVGFRSSDGEVHLGKWQDNLPEDIGARFDKDGNFLSLNNYVHGNKNGIGVSFDQNGNLIVSKWKNNVEVESKIILLGEDNE